MTTPPRWLITMILTSAMLAGLVYWLEAWPRPTPVTAFGALPDDDLDDAALQAATAACETVIAYNTGWIDSSIDAWAVASYHRCVDSLLDRSDQIRRAACWQKSLAHAAASEQEWQAMSDQKKCDYPVSPFWKRGHGEPRRLD